MSAVRRIFLEVITAAETGTIEAVAADLREPLPGTYGPLQKLADRLISQPCYLVRGHRVMACTENFWHWHQLARPGAEIPRGIRLFFFAEVTRA